jgi:hypothetical protein
LFGFLGEMRGEFDALGFAADNVVADCPSRKYPSPTSSGLLFINEFAGFFEKMNRFADGQLQNFGDDFAFVARFDNSVAKARAATVFAG